MKNNLNRKNAFVLIGMFLGLLWSSQGLSQFFISKAEEEDLLNWEMEKFHADSLLCGACAIENLDANEAIRRVEWAKKCGLISPDSKIQYRYENLPSVSGKPVLGVFPIYPTVINPKGREALDLPKNGQGDCPMGFPMGFEVRSCPFDLAGKYNISAKEYSFERYCQIPVVL